MGTPKMVLESKGYPPPPWDNAVTMIPTCSSPSVNTIKTNEPTIAFDDAASALVVGVQGLGFRV